MPEELKIIWILAIGFGIACTFGFIAQRLKLSPILGYLLAGYIIGPNFPGFVADPAMSEQLANIGVTLLMFAVGLNFNWKDLSAVKQLALPGALILSTLSITAGLLYSMYLGESAQAGLVVGLAICVSSTVVIVRVLADQHLLHTRQGHIVVGWTIVEDLVSVMGLILLPAFVLPAGLNTSPVVSVLYSISFVLLKMVALGFIIYFVGEKLIDKLLKVIARTRSHELFTLAILSCVFLIAVGSSAIFGVSLALGAFIAGTVVGKTDVSHQAAANALPMRDAFAVIFFLSVGMLFNPIAVGNNLPLFFGILTILLILRPLAAFTIVKLANYPNTVAFTVALAIGQIGEYSFILAEEGSQLGILPENAYDVIVACAFISIALNPLLFQLFKPLTIKRWSQNSPQIKDSAQSQTLKALYEEEDTPDSFMPKVVVIGYGPMGQMAANYLLEKNYNVTVIDQNIDTVSSLKESKIEAIFGDASQFQILERAYLEQVRLLIITTPDFQVTQSIIQAAKQTNPYVKIIARSHFKSDLHHDRFGDIPIVCDEEASAEKMVHLIKSQLDHLNESIANS